MDSMDDVHILAILCNWSGGVALVSYDIEQRLRESKQPKKRKPAPKPVSNSVVVKLDPTLIIDSENMRELGRIEGNFIGVAELLKNKQRQQAALKLYALENAVKDLRHNIASTHLRV